MVLEFLSREKLAPLAELGTSCPDHFLRTKVKPLVVDLPGDGAASRRSSPGCRSCTRRTGRTTRPTTTATPPRTRPPIRGADPAIVLVPGVGMFSFGKDKQTARVAGEFYVNAINVMRGAESVSTYAPISEAEKFRIEYWALEEAKLARMPKPKPLATRVAFVTGAGVRDRQGHRRRGSPPRAPASSSPTSNLDNAQAVADELGGPDMAVAVQADVSDEDAVAAALAAGVLAFGGVDLVVNNAGLSLSKPLLETTVQGLGPAARRDGQGLVPGLPGGRPGDDRPEAGRRHRLHLQQELAVRRAEQHRLLRHQGRPGPPGPAAGRRARRRTAIRVNGINPDGVVRGSGIFAGGWGAKRAEVYGVKEEDLGAYYAKRTLLGKEVLPEHVADAVFALTGGDLSQTTGLHIPVDSGVAAAFLR